MKFRFVIYCVLSLALAVLAARVLINIAPWRSNQIVVIAAAGVLSAVIAWYAARIKPILQTALTVIVGATVVLVAALHYSRYLEMFPRLGDYYANGNSNTCASGQNSFALLLPVSQPDEILSSAERILANEFEFLGYEPATLPSNLDWDEDPYSDRSWVWNLHVMDYVGILARAYELSGNLQFLRRAEVLVDDWIDDNVGVVFDSPSRFSWDDHSTALRAVNWLYFYQQWSSSKLRSSSFEERFLRVLLAHGLRLSEEEFYTGKHNHGIDQDRALLAISVACSETNVADDWWGTADSRIREQIEFAVSPSGVHLEHSPGYHLYVLNQLASLAQFIASSDQETDLIDYLGGVTDKMKEFVPRIVKPDGKVLKLGDTGSIDFARYSHLMPGFAESLTEEKGEEREANNDGARPYAWIYRDAGYGVLQDYPSGQKAGGRPIHLVFSAAAHEGRGHRQADDLSFVLTLGQADILIDPGVYSYKRDPARDFVTSTAAHNTVLVDGQSHVGWDTNLELFQSDDRYTVVSGVHRNYSGLKHQRWLIYLRSNVLFLVDELTPSADNSITREIITNRKFEQLFHFPKFSEIELLPQRPEVEVSIPSSQAEIDLVITQLGDKPVSMSVYEGNESPMQGWTSDTWGKIEPAPVLASTLQGEAAIFITALEILVDMDRGTLVSTKYSASIVDQHLSISWEDDDASHSIIVNLANGQARFLE